MTKYDQAYLFYLIFAFSIANIIYFLVNGIIDKQWKFFRFLLILVIGNAIYLSAYYIIAEHKIKEKKELTTPINPCDELSNGIFTEKGLNLINKAIKENTQYVCGKEHIDNNGRMYLKFDTYVDGKTGVHKINE